MTTVRTVGTRRRAIEHHHVPGAGVNGSDRITILWPDGTIRNTWLEVSVLPTFAMGLDRADVFLWQRDWRIGRFTDERLCEHDGRVCNEQSFDDDG